MLDLYPTHNKHHEVVNKTNPKRQNTNLHLAHQTTCTCSKIKGDIAMG